MSFQPGLYHIEVYPWRVDISDLYATGNGIDKPITVDSHKQPFIERQVVSTRHLHVFWMIKPANTLLSILFSGTSTASHSSLVTKKSNGKSLSTPMEVPLEDIGTRRMKTYS